MSVTCCDQCLFCPRFWGDAQMWGSKPQRRHSLPGCHWWNDTPGTLLSAFEWYREDTFQPRVFHVIQLGIRWNKGKFPISSILHWEKNGFTNTEIMPNRARLTGPKAKNWGQATTLKVRLYCRPHLAIYRTAETSDQRLRLLLLGQGRLLELNLMCFCVSLRTVKERHERVLKKTYSYTLIDFELLKLFVVCWFFVCCSHCVSLSFIVASQSYRIIPSVFEWVNSSSSGGSHHAGTAGTHL